MSFIRCPIWYQFELLRIESKRNTIAQIINQGAKTENLSELTVQYLTAILATTWLREPKCYATWCRAAARTRTCLTGTWRLRSLSVQLAVSPMPDRRRHRHFNPLKGWSVSALTADLRSVFWKVWREDWCHRDGSQKANLGTAGFSKSDPKTADQVSKTG